MGEIKIKSGNLFDTSVYNNNAYLHNCTVTNTSNSVTITSTGTDPFVGLVNSPGTTVPERAQSMYIPVKPNTAYTIDMSSAPKCYCTQVDNSNVIKRGTQINLLPYRFTTDDSTAYVIIRLGDDTLQTGDSLTFESIQLLEGTYTSETIPEYEPYFLNRPAHQLVNGQWVDIPTHHYTNGRWQGELTSQSPLKFRADGDMLDWRIEGRTSENLYPIEMKDDAWTAFRDGKIISRSDNVLQVLTTDSEQTSGIYTNPLSSALRQLSALSDIVSMSADICCDNPNAKLSIGFETEGKLLYLTQITSDFQHYEVTNFTFSKEQNFVVYCANKQTANIYIKNLMINLGSTALPYEPYGGVGDWDETTQRYKIPVRVEGENLFNSETSTSGYLDVRGVEHPSEKSLISDYISVNANTGYTLGQTGDIDNMNDHAYCFYNSNKECISSGTYTPSANGNIIRLLTPNDCAYFRFTYNHLRELVEFVEGSYTTLPPYSTTTNLYTDHQLMDGDSIDYTTTETTIPLATGNNTLTVDTAVKPSKVFVKFEG